MWRLTWLLTCPIGRMPSGVQRWRPFQWLLWQHIAYVVDASSEPERLRMMDQLRSLVDDDNVQAAASLCVGSSERRDPPRF
jgi:hypothetical protein